MWRNSKATARLLAQVNAAYPKRDKSSDGTIGDSAHAARHSDHNPNPRGVVCALDITDDPKHGCDVWAIAQRIKSDPRCHYVIHDRKIATNGGPWRPYSGTSPHTAHLHVSVYQNPRLYDDDSDWRVLPAKPPTPANRVLTVARPAVNLLTHTRKDSAVVRRLFLGQRVNALDAAPVAGYGGELYWRVERVESGKPTKRGYIVAAYLK